MRPRYDPKWPVTTQMARHWTCLLFLVRLTDTPDCSVVEEPERSTYASAHASITLAANGAVFHNYSRAGHPYGRCRYRFGDEYAGLGNGLAQTGNSGLQHGGRRIDPLLQLVRDDCAGVRASGHSVRHCDPSTGCQSGDGER